MKAGISLQELSQEVARQQESKRDFMADTRELFMMNGSEVRISSQSEDWRVRDLAHQQIATHLDIPWKYYDRLRGKHPLLLDANVNKLFEREPSTRMVRTLDGEVRAFLSNRYRRLDHTDLLQACLPILGQIPEVQFPSLQVTEKKLYIKAVCPQLTGAVRVGDEVQWGIVISNSEVGLGTLQIQGMVFRLVCANGAIVTTETRRRHIGNRIGDTEEAYEIYQDDTLAADDAAFFLKVRDQLLSAVSEEKFQAVLRKLQMAASTEPMQNLSAGVKEMGKRFNLQDFEADSVLSYLIQGGDLTQYGLMNAVTRYSQQIESYDRATELEEVGGKILEMAAYPDWQSIANPA